MTDAATDDARFTLPGERDIRVERVFNAPRERGGHWRFVEHTEHGAGSVSLGSRNANGQRNSRNHSGVSPASRAMPPMVNALIGLWRGMVTTRSPSVITMCLPCRAIRKPAFSSTRTAST